MHANKETVILGSQLGTTELQLRTACQPECMCWISAWHHRITVVPCLPTKKKNYFVCVSASCPQRFTVCGMPANNKKKLILCPQLGHPELHVCHACQQQNTVLAPSLAPKNYSCAMADNKSVLFCVVAAWCQRFTVVQCLSRKK